MFYGMEQKWKIQTKKNCDVTLVIVRQFFFQVLLTKAHSFTHSQLPFQMLAGSCDAETVKLAYTAGIWNQKPKNSNQAHSGLKYKGL